MRLLSFPCNSWVRVHLGEVNDTDYLNRNNLISFLKKSIITWASLELATSGDSLTPGSIQTHEEMEAICVEAWGRFLGKLNVSCLQEHAAHGCSVWMWRAGPVTRSQTFSWSVPGSSRAPCVTVYFSKNSSQGGSPLVPRLVSQLLWVGFIEATADNACIWIAVRDSPSQSGTWKKGLDLRRCA